MVGRPRIKVSVPVVVGALLDVAVVSDHLVAKALLVIPLPTRNLEAHWERECCVEKGCRGCGEGHIVAQLAPVSVFFWVAVEHFDVTRDGYDCYGRFFSPVACLQFIAVILKYEVCQ